jgi:hypothetical protein
MLLTPDAPGKEQKHKGTSWSNSPWKKTTFVVPGTQDSMAGQHLASPLIQLPDADDV